MSSTFLGLQIARSALAASQTALNVVGQNVSNANTDGYTRQSATLTSLNYSSDNSKLLPVSTLNIGQGVAVSSVTQIRDQVLDKNYRDANSDSSTWSTQLSALNDVENVFDETTTDGLNSVLSGFYNSLQNLSNNTGSDEYYSLARSSALIVTQVVNQYASQLSKINDEQINGLNITVDDLNTTVKEINTLNTQIAAQTLRGSVSNDLLDLRNTYIDKISGYMNISVTNNTDGTVSISSTGGLNVLDNTFSVDTSGSDVVINATDTGGAVSSFSPEKGQITGYLNMINGAGSYASVGGNSYSGIKYYQQALDSFANSFAGTFNSINTLDASNPKNLFSGTTAATLTVSDNWQDDVKYIVVANTGTNDNVTKMIGAMDKDIDTTTYSGVSGTFESYARMLVSDVAQQTNYTNNMNSMYSAILKTALNQRESVSGVSTDEETINMTAYQKAYQAAARFMTVLDENLDVLINKTGVG